jgi:AraC family transcriptional regulator
MYRELCAPDQVSNLAIEGLSLELIAAIFRSSKSNNKSTESPPRWLREAHSLIRSRFNESLKLSDISRVVGVHPVTLVREFRRYYHCTIGEMLRRERIEFACREIVKPGAQLSDVATAAGFYDQSHFSKAFKRITGLSPGRFQSTFGH